MDLLEKTFIIKILRPLHKSHVREILHPFKVYFYDLGIRNSLIDDFKSITQREGKDLGAIWENFCVIERIKKNENGTTDLEINHSIFKQYYFWRTKETSPKEYDLIEEQNGHFEVFEMKWSARKENTVKKYTTFFETYPNSELSVIHNENWWKFLI